MIKLRPRMGITNDIKVETNDLKFETNGLKFEGMVAWLLENVV